jgi:hypothetical protein
MPPTIDPLGRTTQSALLSHYSGDVAYTTAQARQQLLDTVAEATDALGLALASLGAAYERLDEYHGGELEEQLFRPVQLAYGRAKRTYADFAGRHGMTSREFEARSPGLPSIGVKGFIERAVEAVSEADSALATLQDSLLPIEAGDAELRAGLAEVRQLIAGLRGRARELARTFGR